MLPRKVSSFRAACRAKFSRYYSGIAHFLFTSTVALTIIFYTFWRARHATWLELMTIPAAFIYANFVEYLSHRNPMHRPLRPVVVMFERHAKSHHKFFTHEAMAYENRNDYQMILFPPAMLLAFFAAAIPPAALLYALFSSTTAFLFVGTGMAYYLTYEWLHFSYHLDQNTFIGRRWLIKRLRQHHIVHHHPGLMNRYNFNITFPICDLLFRTVYHGDLNLRKKQRKGLHRLRSPKLIKQT